MRVCKIEPCSKKAKALLLYYKFRMSESAKYYSQDSFYKHAYYIICFYRLFKASIECI